MTMTDDPDFLDELLSRYLDGEATDEDVARIEADASMVARSAQLQAAIDLVDSPITIPTAELDRIRAVAIAESGTSAVVSDLAARRADKLQTRNRVFAAAAVFVFLAVGFAMVQNTTSDDDTTATDAGADDAAEDAPMLGAADEDRAASGDDSGDDMADDEGDATDVAEEAEAEMAPGDDGDDMADEGTMAEDSADEPAEAVEVALDVLPDDLGAVANVTELTAMLTELRAAADAEANFAPAAPDPYDGLCDDLIELLDTELPGGPLSVEIAPVRVSGLPQHVVLATGVDGTSLAALVAADGCQVLELLGIDGG